jgi:ferredoxin-NADP reductase
MSGPPLTQEQASQLLTLPLFRLQVVQVVQLSADTRLIRFAITSHDNDDSSIEFISSTWPGAHVRFVCQTKSGRSLIRSYTPIIPEVGFLTFAIKHYPDAPKGAKKLMSAYLYNLKQGSDATASGPYAGPPQLNCLVPQTVSRRLFLNETPLPQFVGKGWFPERVGMICVGTGISPMLQVAFRKLISVLPILIHEQFLLLVQIIDFVFSASLSPDSCHSQLSLVFGNRSESDILFSAQLEACRQSNPDRFRAHFFLSQVLFCLLEFVIYLSCCFHHTSWDSDAWRFACSKTRWSYRLGCFIECIRRFSSWTNSTCTR